MDTTHEFTLENRPLKPAERELLLAMIRGARELDDPNQPHPNVTPEQRERWAAQVDSLTATAVADTESYRPSLNLTFPVDDENDRGSDWRFFSAMTANVDAEVTLSIFRDETVAALAVETPFEANPHAGLPAPHELDFRYRCVEDLFEE